MMKKIFLLVSLLLIFNFAYSQYPVNQQIGGDSTIVVSKGALQSRLVNVTFVDTVQANNQRIRQYPGAQIATTAGGLNLWVRNATATAWVPIAVGSGNNIYTIDGTLLANRTLTGGGNSLTFTGLSSFDLSVGNQTFSVKGDTASLARRLSYGGNLGSTFTLYSLVDKNYTDSSLALKLNISDTANMLAPYLRKSDTASMLAPYLLIADTANMLLPYFRTAGVGLLASGQTVYADTLLLSTRAWRQKGIDSVAALINNNVSGISGYVSKFSGTHTIDTSQIYQSNGLVGIGTTSPAQKLDVNGNAYVNGQLTVGDTTANTYYIQGAAFNPVILGRKATNSPTLTTDPRTIGVIGQTIVRDSLSNRAMGGYFVVSTDSNNTKGGLANAGQLRASQSWV